MLYFPKPYPDELSGSLVIRACRHLGLSYRSLMKHLVGEVRSYNPFLVTPYLPTIAKLVGMDVEEYMWRHTIFPYSTSFMSDADANRFGHILSRQGENGKRLGALVQSAIDSSPFRRFCSLCQKIDTCRFGEAYWHRSHNLPAVHVCPFHGERLQITQVPISYYGASEAYAMPGEVSGAIVEIGVPKATLTALALSSLNLMNLKRQRISNWPAVYRHQAIGKGYSLIEEPSILYQISCDLHAYYGPKFFEKVGSAVHLTDKCPWPSLMFRVNMAIRFTPVKHLLLLHFLDQCSGQ